MRPSALARMLGLSADARQAGMITTGRAPMDAWRAPVPQDCWALAVPIPRMLVQPDDAPDDAFAQGVQEDRPVAHVQRA